MKGSIHSDQVCPICGSRFTPGDGKRALSCPNHPQAAPTRFVLRYGRRITKRFDSYEAALQVLTGLRFQEGAGSFDARDYQVKTKPLAFDRLAAEWLDFKAREIKRCSWRSLASGMTRAIAAWGNTNIKNIQYAQLQDFFRDYPGASKSKANALYALKQFWAWAADRYDVPPVKWPKIGHVEMAFRATVDIPTQEAIIDDIKTHEPFRVWLAIKWLATYIAIRPGEMQSLTEGQVDRGRGLMIIPHPKEKRAKVIPLIEEDLEIVRALPLAFSPEMPFFRHESARGGVRPGRRFGGTLLYYAWDNACKRLGIQGVSLYPGTKHSTAMGLRAIYTPEQIQSLTLHTTGAAFRRYFQTGGEDLRQLLAGRKTLSSADKRLINQTGEAKSSYILDFKR
jgi:integrase